MYSGIYKIIGPDRLYIGSAIHIPSRWATHISQLNLGKHGNKHLQRAWNKYGANAFSFEIVEEVKDTDKLLEIEQRWIDAYPFENLYNILTVAGSSKGRVTSEETKEKLRRASLGNKHNVGTVKPITVVEKIKASLKGNTRAAKSYRFINPNGNIVEITNLKAYCKEHGLTYSKMKDLVSGKKAQYMKWIYID